MAKGSESVSFFFPAYYDEKSIPGLARQFHDALKKTGRDFEVIIVDDGSPDNTGKVADQVASKLPKVRVIHHKKNKGYGGALTTGFLNAKKEFAGFTDGDAQYSVKDLGKFLEGIKESDFVIGYREKRVEGFQRKLVQKVYKIFLFLLFGLRVKDPDCSFKMMRTSIFPKIAPVSKTGFFSAELIYRAKKVGLKIKEVPVTHLARPFGTSTFFGFGRLFASIRDMVKVRLGKN